MGVRARTKARVEGLGLEASSGYNLSETEVVGPQDTAPVDA